MKGNVGVLRSRPQSWLPVSLWRTTQEPWCSNSPAQTPDSVTPRWGVRGGMWLDTARGRSTRGRDTSWRTTTENTFPDQYKVYWGIFWGQTVVVATVSRLKRQKRNSMFVYLHSVRNSTAQCTGLMCCLAASTSSAGGSQDLLPEAAAWPLHRGRDSPALLRRSCGKH